MSNKNEKPSDDETNKVVRLEPDSAVSDMPASQNEKSADITDIRRVKASRRIAELAGRKHPLHSYDSFEEREQGYDAGLREQAGPDGKIYRVATAATLYDWAEGFTRKEKMPLTPDEKLKIATDAILGEGNYEIIDVLGEPGPVIDRDKDGNDIHLPGKPTGDRMIVLLPPKPGQGPNFDPEPGMPPAA